MKKTALLVSFVLSCQWLSAQLVKVTDAQTSLPLPGARVQWKDSGKPMLTDGDGLCSAGINCSDSLWVEVFSPGYKVFRAYVKCNTATPSEVKLEGLSGSAGEIIIESTRAGEGYPVVYSTLTRKDIERLNNAQDIPLVLNQLPSVVSNSDAGAGIGYTGIRIRGSDGTRINTTVNGIPINDAESHVTYFVNMPDLVSSAEDIQVQRGVGTSTNGTAAFGGAINIYTAKMNPRPYGELTLGGGSFGSQRASIKLGTGQLKSGLSADIRGSAITSKGYVDRASSRLFSYYGGLNYVNGRSALKLLTFEGKEQTYQAWNGIPEARLRGDVQEMNAYVVRNQLDREDSLNLLQSGSRTYNMFTYKNQTDNYRQRHYQFHASHDFNSEWSIHSSLHYTKGRGYFEEWRKNDPVADYGFTPFLVGNDTFSTFNLARRKWLDNDFYGAMLFARFNKAERCRIIAGGGINRYEGRHFGEIIWAQFMPGASPGAEYYRTQSRKDEANGYIKSSFRAGLFTVFADVQLRNINYSFFGFSADGTPAQQSVSYLFFNPKFGLSLPLGRNGEAFLSWSRGHREPTREDFISSTQSSRPSPERMDDFEGGIRFKKEKYSLHAGLFYMHYDNQLVPTGKLNDVGLYTRTNVKSSFRAGLELEGSYRVLSNLRIIGNLCVSRNRIAGFTEYVDNFDLGIQQSNERVNTPIAFSPDWVGFLQMEYDVVKNLTLALSAKHVSDQYLDNTGSKERMLKGYLVYDSRISYVIHNGKYRICMQAWINNLLNTNYETNGYTWGYIAGGQRISENFYYPAASRYFMGGVTFGF